MNPTEKLKNRTHRSRSRTKTKNQVEKHLLGGDNREFEAKNLDDLEYIIYDLETTGGNPERNGITEVCALKYVRGEVVDRFYSMVNPLIPIPPIVRKMTGITNKMVQDAPLIEDVMPPLLKFIGDGVMVSHNAIGDLKFLRHFSRVACQHEMKNFFLCTHLLVDKLFSHAPDKSLTGLGRFFGCELGTVHRADTDAELTHKVFVHLMKALKSEGSGIAQIGSAIRFQGDYESAVRLGWAIDNNILERLPTTPGVFYLKKTDGAVGLVSSALNIKREVGKLTNLTQIPRNVLRQVVLTTEVACDSMQTNFEALMAECRYRCQNQKLIDPHVIHQRTIWAINIIREKERKICLKIGPAQEGAIAIFGPINDRKSSYQLLEQLAKTIGVAVSKNGVQMDEVFLTAVIAVLSGKYGRGVHDQEQNWFSRINSRIFDFFRPTIAKHIATEFAALSLPEKYGIIHKMSGYVVLSSKDKHTVYYVSNGRLNPAAESFSKTLFHDPQKVFSHAKSHQGSASKQKDHIGALDLEQALYLNAVLWWAGSSINRREGRFIARSPK
jgi:DNA polymerase III epsilon subunit-like protein